MLSISSFAQSSLQLGVSLSHGINDIQVFKVTDAQTFVFSIQSVTLSYACTAEALREIAYCFAGPNADMILLFSNAH